MTDAAHDSLIRDQFTRQATPFSTAAPIADRAALALIVEAAGAGPDDCVLVAGRGHEAFQQVGHDRVALDDRDLVRRYLYNLEPGSPYGALMTVGNS